MADVVKIKAKDIVGSPKATAKAKMLRVAAYCRVSTDQEEQLSSYAAQIRYYTDLINGNPNWELAGIYADEAISGTLVFKRDQFLRLIADCESHKVDMVITKSISRFTRNVADVIKYVRRLGKLNVRVLFEEENIDTSTMDGEMVLSILGATYQQEVNNISAHVKKGLRMKMSRGELVGYAACLGYDYDKETQTLTVNEEEAELVRYIFKRYCDGAGISKIAQELEKLGAKTKHGKTTWHPNGIKGILMNEKYVGDVVQGKTYITDPITKKRITNKGERDKYVISDDHQGIISREVFQQVQDIRQSRVKLKKNSSLPGTISPRGRQYAFSHMLVCGYCGSLLIRRSWNGSTEWKKIYWLCNNKIYNGKGACSLSKGVYDNALKDAFIISFNRIKQKPTEEMMNSFVEMAKETLMEKGDNEKYARAKAKIAYIENKMMEILNLKIDGYLNEKLYKEKYSLLDAELKENQKIVTEHDEYEKNHSRLDERMKEFRKIIATNHEMTDFNREIFEYMIDKVIIGLKDENGNHPYLVTFIYANGMKDTVDTTKMHPAMQGQHSTYKPISNDEDDLPFNGNQSVKERQQDLLKTFMDKGLISKKIYDKSVDNISLALGKTDKVDNKQKEG